MRIHIKSLEFQTTAKCTDHETILVWSQGRTYLLKSLESRQCCMSPAPVPHTLDFAVFSSHTHLGKMMCLLAHLSTSHEHIFLPVFYENERLLTLCKLFLMTKSCTFHTLEPVIITTFLKQRFLVEVYSDATERFISCRQCIREVTTCGIVFVPLIMIIIIYIYIAPFPKN